MGKFIYNVDERRKARQALENNDYTKAKKLIEAYLGKYPLDAAGHALCTKILLTNGCLKKAIKHAEYALDKNKYLNNNEMNSLLFDCVYILMEEENYEDALYYLNYINTDNMSKETLYKIQGICIHLNKKLGLPQTIENPTKYYLKQELDYKPCEALAHTYYRHGNRETHESKYGLLNMSFNRLVEVFNETTDLINGAVKAPYYENVDHYVFKYPNVSMNKDGSSIDYLEVITIKNSNEIVTMYPLRIPANNEYVNILPSLEKAKDMKRTKSSQIDKFNKKYGLK